MAATAVVGGWSHTAWGQQGSQPALAVKVYNYAAAPADVMRAASEKVAVVYRSAGVDLVWIEPLNAESTDEGADAAST